MQRWKQHFELTERNQKEIPEEDEIQVIQGNGQNMPKITEEEAEKLIIN